MSSKDVSTDMEQRNRTLWCLVRVIVCTLWRSKLASTKSSLEEGDRSHHINTLHLIFDDGVVICLRETDFVEKLAMNHKAAPSENQILTALVQEICVQTRDNPFSSTPKNDGQWKKKKLSKSLVQKVVEDSFIPVTLAIGISSDAAMDLVTRFYDGNFEAPRSKDHYYGLIVILNIGRQNDEVTTKHHQRSIYHRLLSACTQLQIPTSQQKMVQSSCPDREAATIIALQQLCYQRRVLLETRIQPKLHVEKKRKHCTSQK
jgi:hypothetical protein